MALLTLTCVFIALGATLGTFLPDKSSIPEDTWNAWQQFQPDGDPSNVAKTPAPALTTLEQNLGAQAAREYFRKRDFQEEDSQVLSNVPAQQGQSSENVNNGEGLHSLASYEQQKPFTNEEQRMQSLRSQGVPKKIFDKNHGVKMGIPIHECDDGRMNITRDWNGNPYDYTCYGLKNLPLDENPVSDEYDYPTPNHMSGHWCMFNKIFYDEPLPTFGDHRPIWPKFGEYTYLPRERYLHNLEHGAVALFYHPCAKPWLVDQVRGILVNCMRRYIITANRNVPAEKPLLLMAWGSKLFMSSVNENEVVSFIRRKAMRAPESRTATQGYYRFGLIRESLLPVPGSDMLESNICPQYDPNI